MQTVWCGYGERRQRVAPGCKAKSRSSIDQCFEPLYQPHPAQTAMTMMMIGADSEPGYARLSRTRDNVVGISHESSAGPVNRLIN